LLNIKQKIQPKSNNLILNENEKLNDTKFNENTIMKENLRKENILKNNEKPTIKVN
jgi:hypothetical protein